MTTTVPVLAFHGDQALRDATVARMRAHRKQDDFIQREYTLILGRTDAPRLRGCFHGCLTTERYAEVEGITLRQADRRIGSGWHWETERLFGIPRAVGSLLDNTFEGLPAEEAGGFAVAVTEAIPVGADLTGICDRLILDVLADAEVGLWRAVDAGSKERAAVDQVTALYRRTFAGETVADEEWKQASRVAGQAQSAARNDPGLCSAAWYVASAVAQAADRYAAGVADSWAQLTGNTWTWVADRLIHHITTAPTGAAHV